MSEFKLPPIGEFKPCVYYNEGLDCLEVHLVDASSTEHQLNEGIIVCSDHSNPKEIHSVQVNNPSQHLPQVTALKAQVKELEQKLSLAERNNIIAHERTQAAFKEGKSYGEKLPQFDLTDEEELDHAQSLAVKLIEDNDKLEAQVKELEEKLSQYEWKDIPDDHVFPTGRYLIEIVDEDGPLVHLMEVEQSFTAIGGCLSFDMPGKRTRYMALPTPPSTQEGEE